MSNDEFLAGLFIGSLGGHILGKNPYKEWEVFINGVSYRISNLEFYKIIIPQGLFNEVPNTRVCYAEAIRAFVYNLPNASLPLLFKCLELGLKRKYADVESKQFRGNTELLINWAEEYLKDRKELTHGFRLLRNLLHEDYLIKEQKVSEAIYNISEILNLLFPYQTATVNFKCPNCGRSSSFSCNAEQNFIGNILKVNCDPCKASVNLRVFI